MESLENYDEIIQLLDNSRRRTVKNNMNGAYSKTLFVSKDDKIFVNFVFHQQIIHDDNDFKKIFDSNINVIFDGRLVFTILWQAIFFPNDLLIYDIY
jgi:hypothetical protein